MSRIDQTFTRLSQEAKKGFIPFITAGDPDLETTHKLLIELARAGATVIELGVPFSDPMADGPVIQRASERALRHGFGLSEVLETVSEARREIAVPIVLFSYFNPLLRFGLEKLAEECRRVGIDGVLVTDLAPEEAGEFSTLLRARALDMIFLVAPTSTDARLQMVAERASGFIYAVSRAGVTGARQAMSGEAEKLVQRVRRFSDLSVAVGFGISTPEQVKDVWRFADAAVVGSAIVAEIEQASSPAAAVSRAGTLARRLVSVF
ncbi:MAG TPA: tryptophan synthase subunit alpha [Pyrinomonadaceae bacterium]|nr:tryptophan synthase subunit alpha [Pyrinomonadaceae bacterium]